PGSSVGIDYLQAGQTDIAIASRAVKSSEWGDMRGAGQQWIQHEIGRDGIAIIVNPSNPINDMTIEEVANFYGSALVTWDEAEVCTPYDWPTDAVQRYIRTSDSGTYGAFEELVVDLYYSGYLDPLTIQFTEVASNEEMREMVAADPNSIGYIGLAYVDSSVKVIAVASACGGTYVKASFSSVLSGSYPASRSLYMITDGISCSSESYAYNNNDLRNLYLDFVYSRLGQSMLYSVGYVPIYAAITDPTHDASPAYGDWEYVSMNLLGCLDAYDCVVADDEDEGLE
ncbi:MAG: hypothetical protein A2161_11630, partial [Candidatus Schekmanbacteria bacterium RBG_13_48_7]